MNNKNKINYTTENSLFFTIARMNPPTPGHLYLIQKLIEEALIRNVDKAYVILSKTNSDNENPIDCKDKINILEDNLTSMTTTVKIKMIENRVKGLNPEKIKSFEMKFVCVGEKESSPFQTLGRILYFDYKDINDINMFVILGDDRQNMVDSLVDMFYEKKPNIKSIDSLILKRESMKEYKNLNKSKLEETDMKNVPISAFSASFVRKIVDYDLKDKFFEIYKPFLKDNDKIENLYNLIKTGLLKPFPKTKVERIGPLKYSYPLIKNEEMSRRNVEDTRPKKKSRMKGGRSRTKKRDFRRRSITRRKRGSK